MGLQLLVICLFIVSIQCGLTQNVTKFPTPGATKKFDKTRSGLYNSSGNYTLPDGTFKETYIGIASGKSQNFSVLQANTKISRDIPSNLHKELLILPDVQGIESNATEIMKIAAKDKKLNGNNSLDQTKNVKAMTENKTQSLSNAVISIKENVSPIHTVENTINGLNSLRKENLGIDMYLLEQKNEVNRTFLLNNKNLKISNETVIFPSVLSITYDDSASESVATTDKANSNVLQKPKSVNESHRKDKNTTASNATSDNNYKLPEIKWRPGMKQPQTISDLIRIAGADMKFIATQFGNNYSVYENDTNSLNENTDESTQEVNVNKRTQQTKTKPDDKTGINVNHESSLIPNDGYIKINEIQTPQLSNVKVGRTIVVPTKQKIADGDPLDGDKNSLLAMTFDGITPETTQDADGFMEIMTSDNIIPGVVVRNPVGVESSRLKFVSIIDSRTENLLGLSEDAFRQNEVRSGSSRRNDGISHTSMAETGSRPLVTFVNVPEYVTPTGSFTQIPHSLSRNEVSNRDSSGRWRHRLIDNVAFLGRDHESTVRNTNNDMNRLTLSRRVHSNEITPSLMTDISRYETSRGMGQVGNFGRNEPAGSLRGSQQNIGGFSRFGNSVGFTPRRDDFRSSTNGMTDRRGFGNSVPVSGMNILNSMIPRQGRRNLNNVARDTSIAQAARRQTFDGNVGGANFMTFRGNTMARNTNVVDGFVGPQFFGERVTPGFGAFASEGVSRNDMIIPRLSRTELLSTFTDFSTVGIPIFSADSSTFSPSFAPSGIFSRRVFIPAAVYSHFSPGSPFTFI